MGSKAPQSKQQSLTPEKQSLYEEDVKEIERCGPSAIQISPSITILEPRNTSTQMGSLPTRDSRFQEKINALKTQSLQPTQTTLVPTAQTRSHNSLDQSLVSCRSFLTDKLQQREDTGKLIAYIIRVNFCFRSFPAFTIGWAIHLC